MSISCSRKAWRFYYVLKQLQPSWLEIRNVWNGRARKIRSITANVKKHADRSILFFFKPPTVVASSYFCCTKSWTNIRFRYYELSNLLYKASFLEMLWSLKEYHVGNYFFYTWPITTDFHVFYIFYSLLRLHVQCLRKKRRGDHIENGILTGCALD